MSLDIRIKDSSGSGRAAKVSTENALNVITHPHPPTDDVLNVTPFRQFFTNNGESSGLSDMRVNGSTTSQDFYILAKETQNVYIKSIAVEISGQNATLNQFGNIGALSNGVKFFLDTQDKGESVINEAMISNYDFVRQSGGNPSFGNTTSAFRASNVNGSSEGYVPFIDLSIIFGLPYGIKLRAGTLDRIVFTVRDNVTGVDSFNIVGYGIGI